MRTLFLLSVLLTGSVACATELPAPDPLFGLGEREVFTVRSETLGREFHLLVRLPRSYAESDRVYPMAFLLDGGILFPMLAPFQLMMEAEGSADEVIVVGISYGGISSQVYNRRSTDYTAPSAVREAFGGASAFQDVLAEEVLPRLLRNYRIDPEHRVLFGQSLGGQFAIHAALTRPELFSTFVAINPAIHSNPDYFEALQAVKGDPPATLVMAMGSEDDARFQAPALEWLAARKGDGERGFDIEVLEFDGRYHATTAPSAYFEVIRRRFPPPEDPGS